MPEHRILGAQRLSESTLDRRPRRGVQTVKPDRRYSAEADYRPTRPLEKYDVSDMSGLVRRDPVCRETGLHRFSPFEQVSEVGLDKYSQMKAGR